jgi:predicted phage tail protein
MTEVIGTEQLREVRLYGHLAKQFGKVHVVAVHTTREAAQALAAIVPGFGQALLEHGAGFHVFAASVIAMVRSARIGSMPHWGEASPSASCQW